MKFKQGNFLPFLFILLISSSAQATGTIQGYVTNPSGIDVVGAKVTGPSGFAITNNVGFYTLDHPAGTYSFTASATGYVSRTIDNKTLADGEISYLDFTLSPMFIETSYPSLGPLDSNLEIQINGGGFDDATRLSLMPDSGNTMDIISQFDSEFHFCAYSISIVGTTAYIVDTPGSSMPDELGMMYIVDIKNPTMPLLLGSLGLPGYGRDIAISGSYAYVPHGDVDLGTGGLFIIDVSSPGNPQLKGSVSLNVAYGVTIIDNTAYVADGNCLPVYDSQSNLIFPSGGNLHAINVANPNSPTIEWSLDAPFSTCAMDVQVSNTWAYVANEWQGLKIVDIDPNSNTFKQVFNSPDPGLLEARGVKVVEPLAFIAAEDNGLLVYDVSNPVAPNLLSSADTIGLARNVDVVNGIAYVADYSSGLSIFDVSGTNTTAPIFLGLVDSEGAALDVVVVDKLAYVANQCTGLGIFNVSSPEVPTSIGSLRTVGHADDVILEANTLYLSSNEEGLYVIDVTDPSSPSSSSPIALNSGTAQRMAKVNNTIYVAAHSGDLQIIDLGTSIVNSINLDNGSNNSWAVYVDSSFIYVADGECGQGTTGGITLVNVADPANTSLHKRVELDGCATDVVVVNKLAYVTVYDDDTDGINDNGLKIINVDPVNADFLKEIGEVNLLDRPNSLSVINDFAYVADGKEGLQIINVVTPTAPQIAGSTGTLGHLAWDVKVIGTLAYVADWDSGIYVVDVSDITNPVIVGSVDTPGLAINLAIDGNVAYVSDEYTGLSIVPLPYEFTLNITEVQENLIKASLPSPLIEGHYMIRVFHDTLDVEDTLLGAVTFTNEQKLLTSKAIIVAGGGPSNPSNSWNNLIWEETKAYANYAYDNLIYQGYKHEDIIYITDEPNPLARYGTAAVAANNVKAAIKINLQNAITTWALSGGSSDLLLYMDDHGNTEEFILRGGTVSEKVTAAELDSWLDILQTTPPDKKVILIYDACRSGSFIYRTRPPVGKTRLVLTSSTPDQTAYFLSNTHSFSSHFWSTFTGKAGSKAILTDAYDRASTNMASYQAAQLDANGNGIPNEPEDFTALQGHEGTIYALRRQYNYKNRSKPVIPVVSSDQSAVGATLMAKSVYDLDGDTISRVWAEIYAPDFNLDSTAQTVTGSTLPSVALTGPDVNEEYTPSVAPTFPVHGTYIITYYAEDSSGIYSLPKTSLVTQAAGSTNIPPDQYEDDNNMNTAHPIIVDSPIPQNHSFHVNGDQDWVKFYGVAGKVYNIRAMNPTIISDPIVTLYNKYWNVVQTSNSATSGQEESIIGWTCQVSDTYYVRVTNNSTHFGANVRYKLWVYNPAALTLPDLPGTVSGTITSGGSPVTGALVIAGGQPQYTDGGGNFILFLPSGTHGGTVVRDGYQSVSFSVTVSTGQNTSVATVDMNSVPQIVNAPPTVIKAYEQYSYIPIVVEPDGDSYTFSIIGTPGWASFNTGNGQLSGRPGAADIGTHGPVTITVKDSVGASSAKVFKIEVTEGTGRTLSGILMLLLKP